MDDSEALPSDPLARATRRRAAVRTDSLADDDFRAQRDRDLAEWTVSAWRAVGATLLCLFVAAMLSSAKLVEIAERKPFGTTRDVMLSTAEGIDRVANFFSLNRPADAIASLRGLDDDPARTTDIETLLVAPVTTAPALTAPATTSPPTTVAPVPAATSIPIAPPPAPTTTLSDRLPTSADPLRTLVIGDSQVEFVGQSLTNIAADRGRVVDVRLEFEISTGLARPDYFNWPAREQELLDDWRPEAMVVFFGANDDQDMQRAGQYFVLGTDAWVAEYRLRLDLMLDIASAAGVVTYWILQPPLQDGNNTVMQLNQIARDAAAGRDDVVIVDANTLFSNGDGGYEVFLETDNGETARVRNDDGVHLTRDGSDWLARVLYDTLGRRWNLSP